MDRPKFVGEAITPTASGLHVGQYMEYTLRPAFQTIFQWKTPDILEACAFEGLVRSYIGNRCIPPELLFESVRSNDRLFLDAMCQAIHIRNHHHALPKGNRLFLNISPGIYQDAKQVELELGYSFDRLPEHGLCKKQIVIELLEYDTKSVDLLQRMRDFCREHGVLFAMDDFGKAASNFDRFRLLRPDIVKLDKVLTSNFCLDKRAVKFFSSIVSQFHDHGVKVLAEGIETPKQLEIAKTVGVDYLQGFYLDMPHELPHLFEQQIVIEQLKQEVLAS